jgi:glycerol-3-phosphate dehydrogenase (NAD(P)+)
MQNKPAIGILGAGAWGTTIAKLLSDKNSNVLLWAKETQVKKGVEKTRINKIYLDKIKLNKSLKITNHLEDLSELEILFIVVPTQYIQATLKPLKKIIKKNCILVNCAKGIDIKSTSLISEVINKILPSNKLAIMSGPNFALEIALGKPTASLIATQKLSDAKFIANLISSKTFRPYLSNDIIGAQICGAMKNIYAIGCGIIVGKNFGENAVASVISRSFAEIKSVGKKLGAQPETLSGLSGLGDLFLTCSSKKSRNFSLGFDLAKGKKLENILRSKKTIAEGAYTVRAIKKLGVKLKLSLPLNDAIYKILYQDKDINKTIGELLSRPIIKEN